jgi:gamma-glutamylcyclotransferase
MNYFAYASNLSRKRMSELCADAKPRIVATLPNYKIMFTGYSRVRKGAEATIRGSKGDKVIGGVYDVTESCLRKLDKWEEVPVNYKRQNVMVFTDSGEAMEAITYIKTRQEEEGKPAPEYLAVIQQGYRDWGLI